MKLKRFLYILIRKNRIAIFFTSAHPLIKGHIFKLEIAIKYLNVLIFDLVDNPDVLL